MKNNYNSNPRGSGLSLFNILGFAFAVILMVGYLNNNGFNLRPDGSDGEKTTFLSASINPDGSVREGKDIVLEPRNATYKEDDYSMPSAYNRRDSKGLVRKNANIQDWIEAFSPFAVKEAVNNGIPAGVALAVGVTKIKSGADITDISTFIGTIIEPLLDIKHNASRNNRNNYFKYSANSKLWAEGLGKIGQYSEKEIKQNMSRYGLSDYDKAVRQKLIGGYADESETDRRAEYVADEVTVTSYERKYVEESQHEEIDRSSKREEYEALYEEMVGREVAKEIAKKELKTNKYLTDEDMARLVEETNTKTEKVLENNLAFPGRKINPDHPEAKDLMDITDPSNAQAREELYQKRLKERKRSR
ncbi:MAG: hypothetical protein DHS20C18_18350 [Saprospiraceae bacterium]|nr:MAG: hypothetical protein DHS20C18_18350 [Saprospiraceae bacterium]